MLNTDNLSINLNKLKKLWAEQGVSTVLKKAFNLAEKKLSQSADKRTLLKRDFLFESLNKDTLTHDIERLFSFGLLRPLEEMKSDILQLPFEVVDRILEKANRLLDNEFNIYDHLEVRYKSGRFSWMSDPLSGFVWPQILTHAQLINQKPYGTDVKTVWEIARFQFLSPLAHAYILTGEERYAHFTIDKVNSWIDKNRFPYGLHWSTPMEASIRLTNWCFHLPLMDAFEFSNLSFHNKVTKSILEHLIYIRENLEISPGYANNHYLTNLTALLLSRLIFPSLPWAVESSEFAEKELEREIQRQFKTSGINFEGSLPYHRLSTEICLLGVALIKKSGRDIPAGIVERLREVVKFTRFYADICEECPIIGDNDSGIFVKFFLGQELNRHRYLKYLFDCILNDKSEPNSIEDFLCSVHFANTNWPNSSGTDKIN